SHCIQKPVLLALKMRHFVVKKRYISKCITKNYLGDPDFAALEYAPLPEFMASAKNAMNQLLAFVPKLLSDDFPTETIWCAGRD
ncbi:hypothetical protein, partial [Aeromonas enteropelogenes]|uniref:hypothetical protein n=1 Tax=Aeromonas enteropelogenes TaxID=29489 RepID=UPI0031340FB9